MYMYTYHKYFTKCLKIRCCKSKKDCQYTDKRTNYYLQSKKIPYNDKKKNDKGQTRIYNPRTDNTMTKRKMTTKDIQTTKHKTQYLLTRTSLNTGWGDLRCPGRVS